MNTAARFSYMSTDKVWHDECQSLGHHRNERLILLETMTRLLDHEVWALQTGGDPCRLGRIVAVPWLDLTRCRQSKTGPADLWRQADAPISSHLARCPREADYRRTVTAAVAEVVGPLLDRLNESPEA